MYVDGPKFIYEPTFGSFALLRDNYLVCEASVDETLSLSFRWLINGTQELEVTTKIVFSIVILTNHVPSYSFN